MLAPIPAVHALRRRCPASRECAGQRREAAARPLPILPSRMHSLRRLPRFLCLLRLVSPVAILRGAAARAALPLLLAAAALAGTGCSSLLNEGTAAGAGVAGAAIAGAVTDNAAVATGIGLGVQAGAKAALQYSQRQVHAAAQDRIAQAAGALAVGAVASWATDHAAPLEAEERGRVTVSRLIGDKQLSCKEIVFSVDPPAPAGAASLPASSPAAAAPGGGSAFYVAAICRDGDQWKWASAEPATARWGNLQ